MTSNKLLFWRPSVLVHNISTAECLRNVHLTAAWRAHVKYARDVVCSWREHERDSLRETDDGDIIVTSLFLNFCLVHMNNLFYIYIITYSSSYGYMRIRNWPAPECGFFIYSGLTKITGSKPVETRHIYYYYYFFFSGSVCQHFRLLIA